MTITPIKFSIVLICFALYFPTIYFDFVYDDGPRIVRNPLVTSGAPTLRSIFEAFSSSTYPGDLYRPITDISFVLNHKVSGLSASAFHAVNIVLHSIVCLLVYNLYMLVFNCPKLSAALAILFAVHPVHVEAVANISGRAELLSVMFGLSALLTANAASSARTSKLRHILWIMSAIGLLLAALSKESGIIFLILIPLALHSFSKNSRDAINPGILYSCTAVCAALGLRYMVLRGNFFHHPDPGFPVENPLLMSSIAWETRLIHGLSNLGWYLKLLIVPRHLSADYSMSASDFSAQFLDAGMLLNFSLLLVWITLALGSFRTKWGFFGIWFLLAFLPTSNLLFPIGVLRAERLCYLPSIGFFGFLIPFFLMHLRFGSARFSSIVFYLVWGVMAAGYAARAAARIPVWQNNERLFLRTVLDQPSSPKAHELAGRVYFHELNKVELARKHFDKAMRLQPGRLDNLNYLLKIAAAQRDLNEAREFAREILRLDPEHEAAKQILQAEQSEVTPANIP